MANTKARQPAHAATIALRAVFAAARGPEKGSEVALSGSRDASVMKLGKGGGVAGVTAVVISEAGVCTGADSADSAGSAPDVTSGAAWPELSSIAENSWHSRQRAKAQPGRGPAMFPSAGAGVSKEDSQWGQTHLIVSGFQT
jgi:hypothetical protein